MDSLHVGAQVRFKSPLRRLVWTAVPLLLAACQRTGPDRTSDVQLPLFLLVLGAPILSLIFRSRGAGAMVTIFLVQVVAYVVYETGVSVDTNIRIDIPLIILAFIINFVVLSKSAK